MQPASHLWTTNRAPAAFRPSHPPALATSGLLCSRISMRQLKKEHQNPAFRIGLPPIVAAEGKLPKVIVQVHLTDTDPLPMALATIC